jgi:hypothetical protein
MVPDSQHDPTRADGSIVGNLDSSRDPVRDGVVRAPLVARRDDAAVCLRDDARGTLPVSAWS